MEIIQALKEFGLSKSEAEIYLNLVKTPGAQPASIIARKTNMNRTTVYKTLVHLTKLRLATKTMKHGITCFIAEDPEDRLKSLVEERQNKLSEVNKAVLNALPRLTVEDEMMESNLPKIRYYEGLEGIKQIYEEVLKEGEDYYRYGDIAKIYGVFARPVPEES